MLHSVRGTSLGSRIARRVLVPLHVVIDGMGRIVVGVGSKLGPAQSGSALRRRPLAVASNSAVPLTSADLRPEHGWSVSIVATITNAAMPRIVTRSPSHSA